MHEIAQFIAGITNHAAAQSYFAKGPEFCGLQANAIYAQRRYKHINHFAAR
jgi:hypothetical protein